MDNEQLLEKALDSLPLNQRNDIPKGGMEDFLINLSNKFLEERVKNFREICKEAREVNALQLKQLAMVGHKTPTRYIGGKVYEGSTGWSKDLSLKHKWVIPMQLKFFMRNVIYKGFWDDENSKVRDKFMKGILRGDDPYDLLREVRVYYGSNPNTVSKEEVKVSDLST